MEALLNAVEVVVRMVSPDKVEAIASRIGRTEPHIAVSALASVVSTPAAFDVIEQLIKAWRDTSVSPNELAMMLRAAGHVVARAAAEHSIELVLTGPTTPVIAARRTEQALLQVINSAKATLFITSFVAYDITSIVNALNNASARGVSVCMLLELSKEHGGSITVDAIGAMRRLAPSAKLYAWNEKNEQFSGGRVHAKIAVADGKTCFITSANLTGFAMERNMEAGVLIVGGPLPLALNQHLQALIAMKIVLAV